MKRKKNLWQAKEKLTTWKKIVYGCPDTVGSSHPTLPYSSAYAHDSIHTGHRHDRMKHWFRLNRHELKHWFSMMLFTAVISIFVTLIYTVLDDLVFSCSQMADLGKWRVVCIYHMWGLIIFCVFILASQLIWTTINDFKKRLLTLICHLGEYKTLSYQLPNKINKRWLHLPE